MFNSSNLFNWNLHKGSCQDVKSNCDRYDDAACKGIFEPWARAHCAKRCNLCGRFLFFSLSLCLFLLVFRSTAVFLKTTDGGKTGG